MNEFQQEQLNPDQSQLHRLLVDHFSLEELRTLCFELEVRFDDLGGEGVAAKARELLLLLTRTKRIEALIQRVEEKRPQVDWRAGPPADVACPYKGLHAFREADAPYFFGRGAFTQTLVDAVDT